jgi:Tfp pilus assembly protein PilE
MTPPPPPELPWWQGSGGAVIAVIVAILVVALLAYLISYFGTALRERAEAKRAATQAALDRANRLAIEEHHTMQLDAAQGNPEVLKLVKQMQRGN